MQMTPGGQRAHGHESTRPGVPRARRRPGRRPAVLAVAAVVAVALVGSLMATRVEASITNNRMETSAVDEHGNFIPSDLFGRDEAVFVRVTTNNAGGWLCVRKYAKKFNDKLMPCARAGLRPLPGMLLGDYVPAVAPGSLAQAEYEIDGYGFMPRKGLAPQSQSNGFRINPHGCFKGGDCDKVLQVFINQSCTMSRRAQKMIGLSAMYAIIGGASAAAVGLVMFAVGPAGIGLAVAAGGPIVVIGVLNQNRKMSQQAKTYWEKVGNCQQGGPVVVDDPYATPGNDHTTVVQPVFQPYQVSANPLEAAEDQAWQQHLAYIRAVSETIDRLNAAKAAGDAVSVVRQQRALADYSSKLADAVDGSAVAHANVASAVAAGSEDPVVAQQQINEAVAMRDRIAQSGFTAAEIDTLHKAGLNDVQIAEGRADFANLEPIVEPGEFLSDAMNYVSGDMAVGGGWSEDLAEAMNNETGPAPTNVVANADAATTSQGQAVDVGVLVNDDVPPGAPLAVSAYDTTSVKGGTVACTPAGTCTYTPAPGFAGSDSFTYTAHSDGLTDATATVTITVTPAVPTAVPDALTTAMNLEANVNVLANDVAPAGSTLTVTASDPTTSGGGTVSCAPQGTCTFTPPPDVIGTDSFSYTVSTNQGASAVGNVSIEVKQAIGPPPEPEDDAATTNEATPVVVDVLANDVAPQGSGLQVIDWQATTAANGTVTCGSTGPCTYVPSPTFTGTDTFGYLVTTDGGMTDDAIVTVEVEAVPPTVVDDAGRVLSGDPLALNVLANDTGAPGTTLTVSDVDSTSVAGGTVTCTPTGACTYTSAPGFFGNDSFTYEASTAAGTKATGAVNVQVDEKPNTPPSAADNEFTTAGAYAFDVLWNDSDPDVDRVRVSRVGAAAHGSARCDANGGCLYDPEPGYVGGDEFTYDIADGRGGTATATVRINVVAAPFVNRPPTAVGDVLGTVAGSPGTAAVLANDTDADGHDLILSSWTDGVHGDVECVVTGACTYTPAPGYSGFDVFSYGIDDGNGGTATGTVLVRVSAADASIDVDVTGTPSAGGSGPVLRGSDGTWHVAAAITPADLPQELAARILPATIDLTTTGPHRIDPETVKMAKGWTADPTGTHFVAGPDALVGSSSVNVLDQPKASVQQGTGGDGHVPIVVGNRVFAFFHHLYPTSVTCVDLDLARPCPGYPKQLPFLTTDLNGPAAIVGSKIYVHMVYSHSNVQTGPITMFCWDTATDETCGMINLDREVSTQTPNTSAPVAVDGKVYLAADNGRVYCYDPAMDAACATASVDSGFGTTLGQYYDRVTHDGLIYFSRLDTSQVMCFAAGSLAACPGWEGGAEQFNGWNLVTRHDAAGRATGICIAVPGTPLTCVDDGKPAVRSTSSKNWPAVDAYWTATEEAEAGTRTLYGLAYNVSGMGCWDWALDGPCTGGDFTPEGYLQVDTDGNGLPPSYGGVFDGECAISVGDSGFVYTVDPQGSAPCSRSNTSSTNVIDLRDQRVDGTVGDATWKSVVVNGADLGPNKDFRSFTVTVRDAATGELLLEKAMVGTNGVVDLSGIDAKAHPSLMVGARFASAAANPAWADGDPPRLALNWTSDPQQVEVRTIAEGSCVKTPEPIRLTATITGDPAVTGSGTLQTAGTGCVPLAFAVLEATPEDTPVSAAFRAADADKDPLSYRIVDGPDHGTASGVTGSGLTYTPAANYNGVDAITYVTNDGTSDSEPSQIVITVNPVNDAPVSEATSASTIENIAVDVPLAGTDVDADPVTFRVTTPPAHGTLSAVKPGAQPGGATITYTPAKGYFGPDAFEFVANDGTVDSATSVAQLTVQADPTTTTTTSTTTVPSTSTTSPAATSTTPPGGNSSVTTASGSGPAAGAPSPGAASPTSTVTGGSGSALPLTGADTVRLLVVALGLLVVGGAVLRVRRRQLRSRADR